MIEKPDTDNPIPESLDILVNLISLFVEVLLEGYDVHERLLYVLFRGESKDNFLAFWHLNVFLWRRDEAKSKDIVLSELLHDEVFIVIRC